MTDPRYPWALRIVERLPTHPEQSGCRPRDEWGDGPWQEEPDLLVWRHDSGLPLAIVRSEVTGALCGYVGVLPGHPLFSKPYLSALECSFEAHGGITYSGPGHSLLAPEGAWWFGFDCGHFGDLAPALNAVLRDLRSPRHWARYLADGMRLPPPLPSCLDYGGHYWTVDEVRSDVEALAVQVVAAGSAAVHDVLEGIAAGVRETEEEEL